jgi:nudix-type nucleoside diphosphatase (YffH/AdpP family)
MRDERPRIVATRTVFKGWNKLDIITVEARDRDGAITRMDREVIDHGDAGVVLAVDRKRGMAILVRQWRAPLILGDGDPYLLEACAGILDPGEDAEAAARREAEEEIGIRIGAMRKVAIVLPSAGTLTERMHLFIAEVSDGDRVHDGGGKPGEGENIEIVEIPLADLFDRARRGELQDAKTLILVQQLMIDELQARAA